MSGFGDEVRSFSVSVPKWSQRIFVNTATAVKDSITDGSSITGSTGQPVDTGALKNSWQLTFPSSSEALISTNMVYAPAIEDGVGPHGALTLRSSVGGFHSVKLTALGIDRIIAAEVAK